MTTAYQLPLFSGYPLAALFKMREDRIEEFGLHSPGRGGTVEMIDQIASSLEICPIELLRERQALEVEPDGVMEKTGEQVFCYTLRLPFIGDTELLLFYPCKLTEWPDGEVFRLDLILAVLATSDDEGKRLLAESVTEIKRIISLQNKQIERFNNDLPALVARRMAVAGQQSTLRH